MDFLDALRVLGRRWPIVLVGLLLIAGASTAAIKVVPTNYQASGNLLLLLPAEATGKTTPTSPFLNLDPGLTSVASLIAGTVSTKDVQREIAAEGFRSEYAVALNPGPSPLLVITVEDTDPAEAIATRDRVIDELNAELSLLQEAKDVPDSQFIKSQPNSVGKIAEALPGSKIRALAVVLALGLILTLSTAFLFDRFRLAHVSRQSTTGPRAKENSTTTRGSRNNTASTTDGKSRRPRVSASKAK